MADFNRFKYLGNIFMHSNYKSYRNENTVSMNEIKIVEVAPDFERLFLSFILVSKHCKTIKSSLTFLVTKCMKKGRIFFATVVSYAAKIIEQFLQKLFQNRFLSFVHQISPHSCQSCQWLCEINWLLWIRWIHRMFMNELTE